MSMLHGVHASIGFGTSGFVRPVRAGGAELKWQQNKRSRSITATHGASHRYSSAMPLDGCRRAHTCSTCSTSSYFVFLTLAVYLLVYRVRFESAIVSAPVLPSPVSAELAAPAAERVRGPPPH